MTTTPALSMPGRAAHELDGPLLLLAGPGTGKTYRLAKRIKHLVEERKVDPTTITAITFTNAAAAELRDRISDPGEPELYVPPALQPSEIRTMHSLGDRLIRQHHLGPGAPADLGVLADDHTRTVLLQDAAQLAGLPRAACEDTERCRRHGACHRSDSDACTVCDAYAAILSACRLIDYDDQIILPCRLLRADPAAAAKVRAGTRHLLVDEYQDINEGQFELIRLLTEGQEDGLLAVGDDDQSIYSFRGGSPQFIRDFESHFGPAARVEALRHSHRCHREIVEAALAVVARFDRHRRDKGPLTFGRAGEKVRIHDMPSAQAEAKAIAAIAAGAEGDVLVLVPTRRHAATLAQDLRARHIAFTGTEPTPGQGLPLLGRLAAWLADEADSLALRQCIQAFLEGPSSPIPGPRAKKPEKCNAREEGLAAVARLWREVTPGGRTLWGALSSGRQHPVLAAAHSTIEALRAAAAESVGTFLAQAVPALGLWPGTQALLDEVEGWIERGAPGPPGGSEPTIRLCTFQGAKGLEADTVCVVGLEEGSFPKRGLAAEPLAEQARLLYVAMTRAKRELCLFHARSRPGSVTMQKIHGEGGTHTLQPSQFLGAIPPALVERQYWGAKS